MKQFYFFSLTFFISFCSFGQIILTESFDYTDGSLVGNGTWSNHSGTEGDLLISSGEAVVQHGSPSEDANISFTAVSGSIYYAFDFSVDDLGAPYSGSDNEYFAHFMVGTSSFTARLDIVPPASNGDFSVGIATLSSTAEAIWATDLSFETTYRATVKYDQDTNQTQLWINASSEEDTSIQGSDQDDPGNAITAFALRQSDSSENETVRVDNIIISQSFEATLTTNTPRSIADFKMFPNPSHLGHVNLLSNNTKTMEVTVYGLLGKSIFKASVTNKRLDISMLKPGVYIVEVFQNDALATKKLIIK
ncbi:T9SS type A sorting domain-containing protein [Flavobacteriaceae bacterium GSB9]|nr:T9SS type A sorting domain-containing protein [Flavobacteriaceae bacterium GSB9]